jgi:hypothetical protein
MSPEKKYNWDLNMASTEITDGFRGQLIEDALLRIRENPFKDPRVKSVSEFWIREAFNVTAAQAEKIGSLWITEILGCDENTVNAFKQDVVNDEVGIKHAGSVDYTPNSRRFWQELQKVAPKLVPQEHMEYIIENDVKGDAAWALIMWIDELNPRTNFLTTRLVNNALLYK